MNRLVIKRLSALLITVVIVLGAWYGYHLHANSNALWTIVSRQCVPHQQARHVPSPCQRVELSQGYALLKDKVGIVQYLLIPTAKVSGVESLELQQPQTPNYFYLAWTQLPQLSRTLAKPIPSTLLSLAINAKWGRSQNQLHIHMSCLRGDIAHQLAVQQSTITEHWQRYTLLNHRYWIRALTLDQLRSLSLFQRVATELPDINPGSGREGIAVTTLADGRLVALVLRTDWTKGVLGSAEELQDHRCEALGDPYRN
nr:CDP-diacylglycerol diphosphatase [Rosenbergiella collisarenosi]